MATKKDEKPWTPEQAEEEAAKAREREEK